MNKTQAIRELRTLPGVGKSIAHDLWDIGIHSVSELKGKSAEDLYNTSNKVTGKQQDRCLLYVFRCAVYAANTPEENQNPRYLKWWNWKDV